jgi:hypothetical protein
MRTRMVAMVCAVLMVLAGASAVFGWINLGRARAADAEAQKSRGLAEKARGDAEKLVAFLIDDFYTELEPTGRPRYARPARAYDHCLLRRPAAGTRHATNTDVPRDGDGARRRRAQRTRRSRYGVQVVRRGAIRVRKAARVRRYERRR